MSCILNSGDTCTGRSGPEGRCGRVVSKRSSTSALPPVPDERPVLDGAKPPMPSPSRGMLPSVCARWFSVGPCRGLWDTDPMMDVVTALKTRSSIRAFKRDPVDDAVLRRVLDAAREAPSWSNTQPYLLALANGARCDALRADMLNAVRTST